jgi:hypothetical protein
VDVPMIQLLEQAVCRDYYRTTYLHTDQQLCKVEPVQSSLASLLGWQRFFMFIPGAFAHILKNKANILTPRSSNSLLFRRTGR